MDNLEVWNKLCRPPKEALKTIGGGRLKGMTDVNPQWRIKSMTEHFGLIGFGWKYQVVEYWKEECDGQVACFVRIQLFIKDAEKWSDPIEGIGGSMLLAREKSGLYLSDEAYKMALTDAISVAMKQLGVAADIYAGLWDGSKYRDTNKAVPAKPKEAEPPEKSPKELVDEAYMEYTERFKSEIPENHYVVPAKFKAELSKILKSQCKTKKDLANYEWSEDSVKMLVMMLKLKDVIEEVPA